MGRFIGITVLLLLSLLGSSHAASESKVAVLYVPSGGSFTQVFSEVLNGINSHPGVKALTFAVGNGTDPDKIIEFIEKYDIRAVIALGQTTYDVAHKLNGRVPVIHGGVLITPNGHSGISLVGSPAEYFSYLHDLAPNVKRVFTVYSEENSGWLIDIAKKEAKKYEIELIAAEADNMRDSVHQFRNIMNQSRDATDAIWLLLDKVLPDKTVLPLALENAWEKGVILFSNNPNHTRRGALFSLFPDNDRMGFNLAALAVKQIKDREPTVLPLGGMKISFNERTAAHLGLHYSKTQLDGFDIVYPQK